MKKIIISLILCCAITPLAWPEIQQDVKKNCNLLGLILAQNHEEGRYMVVEPKTGLGHLDINNKEEINQAREYIKKELIIPEYDIFALLDALFELNRESISLEIESDMQQGYVIDRDNHFMKYFEKNGGGFKKLYQENPKAFGITVVSIPVYDEKSNIILVYLGTQAELLAGAGWVIAYRIEGEKLIELGRVMLWIS
ncbi:MAG: hypothetical protein A2879_04825 [Omnitrophica WOR_2 bacterium RIFCSPHIGHO2_01_FULL_49_10]|nr:MAG: hypothetical protein A2879_04825 [Omnitrophica WOR_2 bacterium RIFCSPHIGHO2_01_FULL_49_10]